MPVLDIFQTILGSTITLKITLECLEWWNNFWYYELNFELDASMTNALVRRHISVFNDNYSFGSFFFFLSFPGTSYHIKVLNDCKWFYTVLYWILNGVSLSRLKIKNYSSDVIICGFHVRWKIIHYDSNTAPQHSSKANT